MEFLKVRIHSPRIKVQGKGKKVLCTFKINKKGDPDGDPVAESGLLLLPVSEHACVIERKITDLDEMLIEFYLEDAIMTEYVCKCIVDLQSLADKKSKTFKSSLIKKNGGNCGEASGVLKLKDDGGRTPETRSFSGAVSGATRSDREVSDLHFEYTLDGPSAIHHNDEVSAGADSLVGSGGGAGQDKPPPVEREEGEVRAPAPGDVGFRFEPPRYPINWRRLAAVNVNTIERRSDVAALSTFLEEAGFGDVESGEGFSDEEMAVLGTAPRKALALVQGGVQYMLYCSDVMGQRRDQLAEANRTLEAELEALRARAGRERRRAAGLRREGRKLAGLLGSYGAMLRRHNPDLAAAVVLQGDGRLRVRRRVAEALGSPSLPSSPSSSCDKGGGGGGGRRRRATKGGRRRRCPPGERREEHGGERPDSEEGEGEEESGYCYGVGDQGNSAIMMGYNSSSKSKVRTLEWRKETRGDRTDALAAADAMMKSEENRGSSKMIENNQAALSKKEEVENNSTTTAPLEEKPLQQKREETPTAAATGATSS